MQEKVNELFPYSSFGIRLEFGEKKNLSICYFECEYHLQKYIERTKLKSKDIKVLYRDEKPTRTNKTKQKSLQQGTTESSDGGTSRPRRNTKDLDAGGIIRSSHKSKPKSK